MGSALLSDVEPAASNRGGGQVGDLESRHVRARRALAEQRLQLVERLVRARRHDLHPPIRQVLRPAAQPEARGVPVDEPAKADALHLPADDVAAGHAPARRQARNASTAAGMREIAMIARITRLKFSRTTGRLPKK